MRCGWALRTTEDELNINMETIRQILHEDLRVRKVRPRETQG
jgi:hypothetical protein